MNVVGEVDDGVVVLELIKVYLFDVVLLDYCMFGMDGV